MSDEKIVSDMIKYIEDKERKVQASKLANCFASSVRFTY